MTLAVLAAAVGAVYALASKGMDMLTDFARQVPELVASAEQTLVRLEARMLEYIAAAPQGVSGYLESALDSVGESLYKLPAALSQWGLELVARTAQSSPNTLLFAVTAGIGTYFASASYPQLTAFLAAQIPAGLRRRFSGVGGNLKGSFGGWLRAQLILMLMTFFELLIGFLLLRVRGAPGHRRGDGAGRCAACVRHGDGAAAVGGVLPAVGRGGARDRAADQLGRDEPCAQLRAGEAAGRSDRGLTRWPRSRRYISDGGSRA